MLSLIYNDNYRDEYDVFMIINISLSLKVPQHVSDEDPVFNRTLRALKSHPNARHDDYDDDYDVDEDEEREKC